MERTESKINVLLSETDKQNRRIKGCITDIRILEEKEKVTRELIDLLKEADMNLLEMVEEQKKYINNLMRMQTELNAIQNEQIDRTGKMIITVAIALLILFIVVILK